MKLYCLMDWEVEDDYSLRYREFTYDMYALCKKHDCRVDFLDRDYDRYCDPEMDYNSPEELAGFTLSAVNLFVAIIHDESAFPRKRIDWVLEDGYYNKKMYVLIFENDEKRAAPISKDSLKYKLYFEEKMYPQSFAYYDELTFWIAIQVMIHTGLSRDVIKVNSNRLFFGDVYIGLVSRIPAICRPIEYRNAAERGADPDRVAVDIIKAIVFVVEIQRRSYHEQFRHIMDAQMRGDNIGVSLMINHESLCEEIDGIFKRHKKWFGYEDEQKIEIILTKMQLGLLNSFIINYADDNRDNYAKQLSKDINKYRNRLKKIKAGS